MPRCSHCGESVGRDELVCPACLQTSSVEAVVSAESMVAIARFRNAAEAGYFAHELQRGADISAVVTMDESFDAVSGYWSTRFVLAVPEELSEAALLGLQRLIDHSEPDDIPFDSQVAVDEFDVPMSGDDWIQRPAEAISSETAEHSNVNWVPIVLTLAAGSIVFAGVRAMQAKPHAPVAAAGARNQPDVWEMLSTPERPWVQRLDKGRRELRFDSARRQVVLYEDLDGDGRFETKIPIREFAPHR